MTNSQGWNEKSAVGNEQEKKREGAPAERANPGKQEPGEHGKARDEKHREGHAGVEKEAPGPSKR